MRAFGMDVLLQIFRPRDAGADEDRCPPCSAEGGGRRGGANYRRYGAPGRVSRAEALGARAGYYNEVEFGRKNNVKELNGPTIEALLDSQGVQLTEGRADRLAAGVNPILSASAAQTCALPFELEPAAYMLALDRCKAKS
jgi:hypothetical protein